MTNKTTAAIKSEIASTMPDNTSQLITPAILRAALNDIADSYLNLTTGANLSAAGSNQGNATALTNTINEITTCTAGQGVVLATITATSCQAVINNTSTPCLVYPSTSASIEGGTVNIPISLAPGDRYIFQGVSTTNCYALNVTIPVSIFDYSQFGGL